LQLSGCNIIDVSGPAVSNQWIINKTFLGLQQHPNVKTVIIQLTNLGKLDVDVDQERIDHLVAPDPLRNFVIDKNFVVKSGDQITGEGVWPSSISDYHVSKQYWNKWLVSPELEKEDLYCKLILLKNYCQQHDIELLVYQGYDIVWQDYQIANLQNIIKNINANFYSEYLKSAHYHHHNYQNNNTVPCIGYQLEIAQIISKNLPQFIQNTLTKFKLAYDRN
jgi:hypothetical protein